MRGRAWLTQAPARRGIGLRLVLLAAVAVTAAVVPSQGAPADWRGPEATFLVTAHDNATASWFEVVGLPGRNPEIPVAPGAWVTIVLHNNGTQPHSFWATALGGIACCVPAGGRATGTFIAPTADTTVAYSCGAHPESMRGRFVVGQGARHGTPLPWAMVPLALAIALACALAPGALPLRKPFGSGARRQRR